MKLPAWGSGTLVELRGQVEQAHKEWEQAIVFHPKDRKLHARLWQDYSTLRIKQIEAHRAFRSSQ